MKKLYTNKNLFINLTIIVLIMAGTLGAFIYTNSPEVLFAFLALTPFTAKNGKQKVLIFAHKAVG